MPFNNRQSHVHSPNPHHKQTKRNISNNQRNISKSSGRCQVATAKTPKQERRSRTLDNKADKLDGGSSSVVFDVSFDNPTDGKGLSSPPVKRRLEAEARKTQALIIDEETRLKNIQQKQELVRLRKDSLSKGVAAKDHNVHVLKVCIGQAVKQKQEKKNAKHEVEVRMRQALERRQQVRSCERLRLMFQIRYSFLIPSLLLLSTDRQSEPSQG